MHDPRRLHLHTLITLALLAGCGDDGDSAPADTDATTGAGSTSTDTPAPTTEVAESTESSPTTDDTSTSLADGSSGAESTGAPNVCGTPPPATDPCLTCGWEECGDPYVACCELTLFGDDGTASSGCLPLVSCALATGCVHATCYQPDTCMAEVDGAGGITGDGTAAAGAFGDCLGAAVAAAASDACAECQAIGG
jgi:hypothetical protein